MRLVSKHHPVSNSCNIVTGNVHVVGDNFPFDAPFFFRNSFPWKTTRFFASHFSGSSSNNYPLTFPTGSIHKYATNPVHFKQHFIRMFFADLFVCRHCVQSSLFDVNEKNTLLTLPFKHQTDGAWSLPIRGFFHLQVNHYSLTHDHSLVWK